MAVETFTYINSLDITLPAGSDPRSEGDNHARGTKVVLKNSFPAITGAVTATQGHLNNVILQTTAATDMVPYFASGSSSSTTPFTAYGRTVVGLADAGALRANLSLDTLYAAKSGATFAGAVVMNGGTTISYANPALSLTDTATAQTRYLYSSGGNFGLTNTSAGLSLYVNNSNNGVIVGNWHVGGSLYVVGTTTSSSDETLKTDIETSEGLNLALKLKGRTFNWIESGAADRGVIAQELQAVCPELVHVNPETETLTVNYNGLSSILIESIRDLVKELDATKSSLIQEVYSLRDRLDALEAK